jgi:transposase
MSDPRHGSDRLGRRAKRFLTPLQKYELWLQLVRGEDHNRRGRRAVGGGPLDLMRLREVAKQGALAALAEPRPGVRSKEQDLELVQAKAEAARLGGKTALGLSGPVPSRADAATKAGLLDLLERAVEAGWQFRAPYQVLGDDYFQQRHSLERHQRQLVRQLEQLGHKVTPRTH